MVDKIKDICMLPHEKLLNEGQIVVLQEGLCDLLTSILLENLVGTGSKLLLLELVFKS